MEADTFHSQDSIQRSFVRRGTPKAHEQRTEFQPKRIKKETKTVLVFEPDGISQKKLRTFLRSKGFQAVSTQRPEGVEVRFKTWPKPDLLIISAHQHLPVALRTFNAFSWNPILATCPVILIGSSRQEEILTSHAKVDHLRKVILSPFKTELLVRVMNSLIHH